MIKKSFGDFFKERRIALGLTLREFCEKYELDPGNICKLETGRLSPPHKESILKNYARYLKLKRSTEEWHEFLDLAAIESQRLPSEFTKKSIVKRLPLFFRTIRDKKLSKEKLDKLIKLIKES